MDLGLLASQAAGVEKTPMAEGCPVIGGRVAVTDWWSCRDVGWREERFFLRVPFVNDSYWLLLVLSPHQSGHKYLILSLPILAEPGPRGHYGNDLNRDSMEGNWAGCAGVPVTTRYLSLIHI